MRSIGIRTAAAVLLVALGPAAVAAAPASKPVKGAPAKAGADPAPAKPAAAVPLLPGSGSKEPVNITADKLDFLNKENKLIYTGNVVVVQGDSTMKASVLRIDLQKTDPAAPAGTPTAGGATAPSAAPGAGDAGPGQNSSVRHMDADGPVTLISKDQIGTGDHAIYDKGEDKVYLNGNVTLSQGTNVTQGDRLIYNMTTGQAQVFSGQTNGGRVVSVFTPGSAPPGGDATKPAAKPEPKKAGAGKAARKTGAPKGEAAVD